MNEEEKSQLKKKVIKQAMIYTIAMFIFSSFFLPWINDEDIVQRKVLINIPVWILAGIVMGFVNYRLLLKKDK